VRETLANKETVLDGREFRSRLDTLLPLFVLVAGLGARLILAKEYFLNSDEVLHYTLRRASRLWILLTSCTHQRSSSLVDPRALLLAFTRPIGTDGAAAVRIGGDGLLLACLYHGLRKLQIDLPPSWDCCSSRSLPRLLACRPRFGSMRSCCFYVPIAALTP
jgi:hypothetical protein